MKKIRLNTTLLTVLICLMSIFALISCGNNGEQATTTQIDATTAESVTTVADNSETTVSEQETKFVQSESGKTDCYANDTELGEGDKTFTLKVVDGEKTVAFTIHTNEQYLDRALLAHRLIAGDDSQYGLYVKEVNGVVADYDTDGTWWGLYENGTMAATGVSSTEVKNGAQYELTKSK